MYIYICMFLQVRDLEDAAVELLEASEDCTHLSSVIQSLGNEYQPGPEVKNPLH